MTRPLEVDTTLFAHGKHQALEDAVEYLRDLVVREPQNEGLRSVLAECEAELYGQGGSSAPEVFDGQQGASSYYGASQYGEQR